MAIRIFSSSINAVDSQLIEVEVDSTPGLHVFNIVGLPDKAVQESRDRIASAVKNSGLTSPNSRHKKIIVNLAPADIKKEGPAYDLPIALGYLLESEQIKFDPSNKLFIGELSLDGSLKHTNGILATAILAKNLGFKELIIPHSNLQEASVIKDIRIVGARSIKEVVGHLNGTIRVSSSKNEGLNIEVISQDEPMSLASIKGQESAKRTLVMAAAGGHNILMFGPPGSGKSILAKSLPELMPKMTIDEAIEVAKIYSSVGLLNGSPLFLKRPFRSPHHTTSAPAMVGGGTWPRPGEISLAHRGVLFLDELPEFPRNVLESLRQPLEDGVISVSRTALSIILPAKFTLVAAMNSCPCGNFGDDRNTCVCLPFNILRYRKKISGPLLDRIDIQINVPRETLTTLKESINSIEINKLKAKIAIAREIQLRRFRGNNIFSNSEISYKNIDKLCILTPDAEKLLSLAVSTKGLSLRAYHKIKKLGRTIADLEQSELIRDNHIAEAVSLRLNDKFVSELV